MKKSSISNSHILLPNGFDYLIADSAAAQGKKVAIEVHDDGRCTLDLDGFLIAPLYVFSKRQLREIGKRARAANGEHLSDNAEAIARGE